MDRETREFIEDATLLFIATRNAAGAVDVSPRGGQPRVLALTEAGELLLPDYRGNRRLDTIGNLLARPDCALAILRRGSDEYLRLRAQGKVSFAPELLARFPADESRPISVLRLVPEAIERVASSAFARAGFWQSTPERKPPLDLVEAITRDKALQAEAGLAPVLKPAEEESLLEAHGIRAVYGSSSEGVQKKVGERAGPSSLAFMAEARFTVFAHVDAEDRLRIELAGEAPLEPVTRDNRQGYRLRLPPEARFGAGQPEDRAAEAQALGRGGDAPEAAAPAAQSVIPAGGQGGLLAIAIGRAEILRLNGQVEPGPPDAPPEVAVLSEEVFFHCPAALNRARIWQADRRVPWIGKRDFRLIARRAETPQVTSFDFAPVDEAPLGGFRAGQYVTVSLSGDAETGRQRCYSLTSRPGEDRLSISVRRLGRGGLSDALHDRLQPGDLVQLGIPAGRFTFETPPDRPAALISAGVGITPLFAMLADLATRPRAAPLWFVHAARDLAHYPLRAKVEALLASQPLDPALAQPLDRGSRSQTGPRQGSQPCAQKGPQAQKNPRETLTRSDDQTPRLHGYTALSQPGPGELCDHVGRLDAAALARAMPLAEMDVYLCGPEAFMADLTRDLLAFGLPEARIHKESFVPGPGDGLLGLAPDDRTAHEVVFAKSGRRALWRARDGSLLDLALSQGVRVAYSCRSGECQSCLQRVLEGAVAYPMGDLPVLGQGQALLCQSIPKGRLVLDC